MSLLHCSHCGKSVSATHKRCPHCDRSLSILGDLRAQVEHNRFLQAALVIVGVLLLGVGWFWRMDSGDRWPLYVIIFLIAPLVPWLLQLAYKNAAPVEPAAPAAPVEEEKNGGSK